MDLAGSVLPPADYVWIVAMGGIVAFIMAYGIGANDVANAFATSVGSKTLKLWQAVCIAAVFEFSGSLMGSQVTATIAGDIADTSYYESEPAVLMLGMLCALIGAGSWVLIATRLGLPVSTTHAIIGAIIGFSVVAAGFGSVYWDKVGLIVASWVISPVLAGCVSSSVFLLVRRFILRAHDSLRRGFIFYPFLIAITVFVNCFYVTYKGLPAIVDSTTLEVWKGILISLGVGIGVAVIMQLFFVPWLKRRVETVGWGASGVIVPTTEDENASLIKSPPVSSIEEQNTLSTSEDPTDIDVTGANYGQPPKLKPESAVHKQWSRMIGEDMEETAFAKENVKDMHRSAETFDSKTEHIFSYLQVVTACFMSFAHGANDVANAMGPFNAIYGIYKSGGVTDAGFQVELWILALGGAGIVLGLMTYGYNVMRSIGIEMIKITPARGFCIELSSATVVIFASLLEIPISSTHCQVGSTIAVGLCEGKSGFNVWLFIKTFVSWVFTLIFASVVTAGIFSFAHFAP